MSFPFTPKPKSTVNISASTTASAATQVTPGAGPTAIRIANPNAVTVFVAFGTAGVSADLTSSIPILANTVEVLMAKTGDGTPINVSAITASGTATIYFTPGEGI